MHSEHLIVGASSTGVYRSSDGGKTWERIIDAAVGEGKVDFFNVVRFDPKIKGRIYVSGFSQFTRDVIPNPACVFGACDGSEAVPGTTGKMPLALRRSDDNGESWTTLPISGRPLITDLEIESSSGDLFVSTVAYQTLLTFVSVGNKGVLKSSDHGGSWMPVNGGTKSRLSEAPVLSLSSGLAVPRIFSVKGLLGELFESIDGGLNWKSLSVAPGPAGSQTMGGLNGLPGGVLIGDVVTSDNTLYVPTSRGVYKAVAGGQVAVDECSKSIDATAVFVLNVGESKCGFSLLKPGEFKYQGSSFGETFTITTRSGEVPKLATRAIVHRDSSPNEQYWIVDATTTEPASLENFPARYIVDVLQRKLSRKNVISVQYESWEWSPSSTYLAWAFSDEGSYNPRAIRLPETPIRSSWFKGGLCCQDECNSSSPSFAQWLSDDTFELMLPPAPGMNCSSTPLRRQTFQIAGDKLVLLEESTANAVETSPENALRQFNVEESFNSVSLPSYVEPRHRLTLTSWLDKNSNFRPAIEADCCKDAVSRDYTLETHKKNADNRDLYYAVGDFNGNGKEDFAISLVDHTKDINKPFSLPALTDLEFRNADGSVKPEWHKQWWNAAIAVFEGPFESPKDPVFFEQEIGNRGGAILWYRSRGNLLLQGPAGSSSSQIKPAGNGYIRQIGG